MNNKLPTKTAKITSLENLYVYGSSSKWSLLIELPPQALISPIIRLLTTYEHAIYNTPDHYLPIIQL